MFSEQLRNVSDAGPTVAFDDGTVHTYREDFAELSAEEHAARFSRSAVPVRIADVDDRGVCGLLQDCRAVAY